jgi:cell division protein FtsA
MFNTASLVAGLEIGTSKICVVVGKQNSSGSLNILGVGQSSSRGIRKGEVINPKNVEADVREALTRAEQMADVEIRHIYLGVTGGHIRSLNNRGFRRVSSVDLGIMPEDVEDVVNNAKAINLPVGSTILHFIRQHFRVDGEEGVTDPVGMHSARLELDMHIIIGLANRLQNTIQIVQEMSLEVEGVVFNGIASSLALLTDEQKELGALVIDIGAGTTEYVVFSEGGIRHSGILAVGGDHVTNDLAFGLKISLSRAERLKMEHGSAIIVEADKERMVSVKDENGFETKRVKTGHVQQIMSARLEEALKFIAEDLEAAGLTSYLRAGVILCGGSSRTPGLLTLTEKVFQMSATIGHINTVNGLPKILDEPEFATTIGLVKYGSLRQRHPVGCQSFWSSIRELIRKLIALLR